MKTAYSYARYSSPSQADGDSIRRQTEGTIDWCKRHDVQLDTNRTFLDRGRSAYSGKHRQRGSALNSFLAEVESGQIPRESVLIIENLDRLSRENPGDAVPLLCSIVNAGISVVTLHPSEMTFERGSDLTALILAVVEFGRSHSESKSKGQRVAMAWEQKRKAARETHAILTRQLPAWIEVRGKKFALIPERARIVRHMFKLAIGGYGLSLIVRELTRENVPTWGRGRSWSKAYVHKILSGRAAIGDCQPTVNGKPDGEPIANYYPAIIDEATWVQAQAAFARRKNNPGRVGKKVATLFGGLLRDAATHDPIRIAWQVRGKHGTTRRKHRALVPSRSMEGAAPCLGFSHDVFEQAILKLLKELNPADVIGKEPESESANVAADLAAKELRVKQIEAELIGDGDDIPALVRVVRSLNAECNDLRKKLSQSRRSESSSQSAAWTETMTLIDVAKDESHRLRLRDLLRTVIDEILIVIVKRRSHRFCACQVLFRAGTKRDFLIWTQASYGHKRSWLAGSFPGNFGSTQLDFRNQRHVKNLTDTLQKIDVDLLVDSMKARD
jgi:DNA invertase Pin-like site-specific DNA recombinase